MLNRRIPLKRTALRKRARPKPKGEREAMQEYCEGKSRCAVCWVSAGQLRDPFRKIDFHHLMGRFRKKDDPRNLLPLDSRLHRHFHGGGEFDDINGEILPVLLPGHLLFVKRESEPALYDEEFLCWLRGWKSLPAKWEPVPLPAVFLLERERNQR